MPIAELQWLQSTGRFVVLGPEQIQSMCKIGPGDNVHPSFSKLLVSSDTAARSAVVLFDPKIGYVIGGNKKQGGSFENNDTLAPGIPIGQVQRVMHDRVTPTIATDLTPAIYPVEVSVRRQIVIDLGPNEWASVFSFYYQNVPGPVIKLSTFLEGLSDRNKMDTQDTATPGESFFRTGQIRQMGDAEPGT